ncbi:unnamed protein product [Prunus brigantina]
MVLRSQTLKKSGFRLSPSPSSFRKPSHACTLKIFLRRWKDLDWGFGQRTI